MKLPGTLTATRLSGLARDFEPRQVVPVIATGLVIGIIEVIVVIALATLIFSGTLSGHLPDGLGLILFSAIALIVFTALTSSIPGVVSSPQDTPAAIMALAAAAIATHMPASASSNDTFMTIAAALMLTSFVTGGAFLLLGYFKLGNLVRFIPYPVVGGFLAGVGLLLVRGAITSMTNAPLSLSEYRPFTETGLLAKWLPGLALGLLLVVALRRYSHFLIMPGLLLAATAIFYVVLWITGTSISEATHHGWLPSVFTGGSGLWHPLAPADLRHVHWSVLGGQAGNLAAVTVLGTIGLLLNATALELATKQDVELNRELKVAGLANLLSGVSGGLAGYATVSETVLPYRMGVKSRWIGIVVALVCGTILLAGGSMLSYIPNPVLGGLLLLIGLSFMVEWIYDAWFKLPKADYVIVILILVIINTVGLLQGVGTGIVVAVILFVVNYSRINVIRHELSGRDYHSTVVRPWLYRQLLCEKGDWTYVLKLQGFLFFGTAQKLLEQVRQRIDDPNRPKPHHIVLDFRHVSGLDSSTMLSFAKIKQLASTHTILLVFTALSPAFQQKMAKEVFNDTDYPVWRLFPDLDHGIEWCENQTLEILESVGFSPHSNPSRTPFEEIAPGPDQPARLMTYLDRQEVQAGHYLMRQNNSPSGVYFLETGQVTVQLEAEDGSIIRLRQMSAGTLVGEIGTYLNQAATASVIADQPSTLYHLSLEALKRMEQNDPEIAAAFHRFMARFMAERLTHTTETLQALVD